MKVIFCTPTVKRPWDQYIESLEASVPVIEKAGWEHASIFEIGSSYISYARARLLGKAMTEGQADVVVFIDHDLSWKPEDLLKLIETPGDVVSGLYRFKIPDETYMGALITDDEGYPLLREDGCMCGERVPAGFLKITRNAFETFKQAYPELIFGDGWVDAFNHGAFEGAWWGEDYAFSRRWRAAGGDIWVVPDLDLVHHSDKPHPGNFHQFMLKQPGGSESGETKQGPQGISREAA